MAAVSGEAPRIRDAGPDRRSWGSRHVGYELIGAGMLILAAAAQSSPRCIKGRSHAVCIDDVRAHKTRLGGGPE
jgi:hypothetical protein